MMSSGEEGGEKGQDDKLPIGRAFVGMLGESWKRRLTVVDMKRKPVFVLLFVIRKRLQVQQSVV